jgi:hypothetical protein
MAQKKSGWCACRHGVFAAEIYNNNKTEGVMCRLKSDAKFVTALVAVLSLAFLMSVQVGLAQSNPSGCVDIDNGIVIGLRCINNAGGTNSVAAGSPLVVGQTVIMRLSVTHNDPSICGREGGTINSIFPNGQTNAVVNNVPLICDPSLCDPPGLASLQAFTGSYTVNAADLGKDVSDAFACNPQASFLEFGGVWLNAVHQCQDPGVCGGIPKGSICFPIVQRGLQVTKDVACTTGQTCDGSLSYSSSASGAQDGDTDPKFCYRIIISNTGSVGLNITSVVDSVIGSLTPPGGLPVGASVTNYSGVVTHATTTENTVTVLGFETLSCQQLPVSASDTATATVVPTPITCEVQLRQNGQLLSGRVDCATNCNPLADVGINSSANPVEVSVSVSNPAGNGQSIQSGTVTVGSIVKNIAGPIAPGGSASVVITNLPGDVTGCRSFTAQVQFQGVNTGTCPPLDTTCSKSLEICGLPAVNIIKLVKCLEDGSSEGECETGICSSDMSLYSPSATGVRDAGFCYAIVIENTGNLLLTNVCVTDTQLSDPAGACLAGFPTELAPGQSATNFYQKSYPDFVSPPDKINVAEVLGESIAGNVSDSSNAVVRLLNPSITCEKTVALNGGQPTAGGTVELPTLLPGGCSTSALSFAVNVCNNGDVDLVNVKVIDTGTSGCGLFTNTIASLPIGACTNIALCDLEDIILCCPAGGSAAFTNVVNVIAEVSTNVCSINPENCQRVTTSSSCTNNITLIQPCEVPVPSGCRTTGGGKQFSTCQADFLGDTESTIPTYVTHGGQVGASLAVGTEFTPNTPCIRGEWTHVRHVSPKLRGNFHASSNGKRHDFDSLKCACLNCADIGASVITNNLTAHSGTACQTYDLNYDAATDLEVVDGKCGGKVKNDCANWPAPAASNKIAFSGVGKYTRINGKRDEWVVFRVDIEDRSEPGGQHPGGAVEPADRYRFRLWIIKGNEGGSQGNPDAAAALALRRQVAVFDPHLETVCARAPDIDDGGILDRGNRQLHKPTGRPIPDCPPDSTACDPFAAD